MMEDSRAVCVHLILSQQYWFVDNVITAFLNRRLLSEEWAVLLPRITLPSRPYFMFDDTSRRS